MRWGKLRISEVNDPIPKEVRKQQTDDLRVYGVHILEPIRALTSCPVTAEDAVGMIPEYVKYRLDDIDSAIAFLTEVKRQMEEQTE